MPLSAQEALELKMIEDKLSPAEQQELQAIEAKRAQVSQGPAPRLHTTLEQVQSGTGYAGPTIATTAGAPFQRAPAATAPPLPPEAQAQLPGAAEGPWLPPWLASTLNTPYEFVRRGVSTLPGIPGDIQRLPEMLQSGIISHEPASQQAIRASESPFARFPSSAMFAEALPHRPEAEMSFPERAAGTLGAFAGPGLSLGVLRALGVAPEMMQRLLPLVSAGPLRDLLMGAGAVAGRAEGGPVGEVLGPLAVAAGHAGASGATRLLGKAVLPDYDVRQAADTSRQVNEQLRLARETREAALARREAQGRAATDVATAQHGIAAEEVRATQQAHRRALEPIGPAITKDIPTPGTLEETGAQAQGAVERGYQQQIDTIALEHERLLQQAGGKVDRLEVVRMAEGDFRPKHAAWQEAKGAIFEATEAVTGDRPVVELATFQPHMATSVEQAAKSGQPLPSGATAMKRTSQTAPEATVGSLYGQPLSAADIKQLQEHILAQPGVTAQQKATAQVMLDALEGGGPATIPFWLARRMETALGAIGYGRGAPAIGSITQNKARAMRAALQEDIGRFLQTPEGEQIAPQLAQAKALYIEGIRTYNDSIISRLLDRRLGRSEQFMSALFSGDNLTDILKVKADANPETWQAIKAYKLAEMYEAATPRGGEFTPKKLWDEVQKLDNTGKLRILLTPDELAALEANMQRITALDTTVYGTLRKALAGKTPEQVVPFIFAPGGTTWVQKYKAITTPEEFDTAVKTWSGQLQRDLTSKTPAVVYKDLKKMIEPGEGGLSQLDHMLEQYPGYADAIKDSVRAYEQGTTTIEAAQERLRAKARFKQATVKAGAEGTRETREAQDILVSAAEAQSRAAAEASRLTRERAGYPEEGIRNIQGRFHVSGVRVHTGVVGAGLFAALDGIIAQQPAVIAAGAGLAAVGAATRPLTTPAYIAAHPNWERVLREGLTTRYSPAAISFALRNIGASSTAAQTTQKQVSP